MRGVSFRVEKGEIYGLLGHNGAGKSTALGIILGMIAADGGEVRIGGVSVEKDRAGALRKVGAIFEAPAFYDYLSGWSNLRILAGYSGKFDPKAAREIVGRVGLADRIGSKVAAYSHGMRQRLALAQALIPEPEILLLDEPTDGLDPEGIKWFRDFILELRAERGMTVLFNSHLLSEVEQMCDRVAILRDGERVYEGAVRDLADERPVLQVEVEPGGIRDEVATGFGGVFENGRFVFPEGTEVSEVVAEWARRGCRISEVRRVKRSLEDVYLEFVR